MQPPSHQKAVDFLYGLINYEKLSGERDNFRFRLERMRELLRRLGLGDLLHAPHEADPDARLASGIDPTIGKPPIPTVHLAGTKGKGSTATMIAAMLTGGGLKTGLYTSPHIHDLRERFRVDEALCGSNTLVELVDLVRPIIDSMKADSVGEPTFFELTTAISLLHFRREGCQAQVIEVGLGGRLDSTNVVQSSVSVITTIGLDHQNVLGSTLQEIAGEKAGIIKPGVPVISGVRESPAREVIEAVAKQRRSPIKTLGHEFDVQHERVHPWGGRVSIRACRPPGVSDSFGLGKALDVRETPDSRKVAGPTVTRPALGALLPADPSVFEIPLAVEGAHQADNTALAVAVMEELARQGLNFDRRRAIDALSTLTLPGRIERFQLPGDQLAIIDTAHNEDSIDALVRALRDRFVSPTEKTENRPGTERSCRRMVLVFGTSRDKDATAMLDSLAELTDQIVLTRFHDNPRYCPIEKLRASLPAGGFKTRREIEQPSEAIRCARDLAGEGGVIVVCGSFFLADQTRRLFVEPSTR
ncbi:MAG: cyanophycin synthetase [Planctomycetota bacterium]